MSPRTTPLPYHRPPRLRVPLFHFWSLQYATTSPAWNCLATYGRAAKALCMALGWGLFGRLPLWHMLWQCYPPCGAVLAITFEALPASHLANLGYDQKPTDKEKNRMFGLSSSWHDFGLHIEATLLGWTDCAAPTPALRLDRKVHHGLRSYQAASALRQLSVRHELPLLPKAWWNPCQDLREQGQALLPWTGPPMHTTFH